ncbi:MAG: fasciclin domain-containing protein [Clostridium sp.]|nr:fasciclin domain-containing protein [Clostridium sp.]
MKNYKYIIVALLCSLSGGGVVTSCTDDVDDDSYFTFTGQTLASYCSETPGFGVFARLIQDTGKQPLLASYGHYTGFIPTDEAFGNYFAKNGISYESLTADQKLELLNNHVIRGLSTEYFTKDFEDGALGSTNMNDRYMVVMHTTNEATGQAEIYINKTARIVDEDIRLHNGVVHAIDAVIEPSNEGLSSVLAANSELFSLFSEAFSLTHYADRMADAYDADYVYPSPVNYIIYEEQYTYLRPTMRRLGYTVFAETDEVFEQAGIKTINQLVEYAANYYGREDMNDYTSPRNPLNRFVAYHILDRQIHTNEFVYDGPNTTRGYEEERAEYYETFYTNHLMELKSRYRINLRSNGEAATIDPENSNIEGLNGVVHALNNVLVYDTNVMEGDVLNKRIRVDAFAIPPQLTNNNIRWHCGQVDGYGGYSVTPDFCGDYFSFSEDTEVRFAASPGYGNYQEDEMFIKGWFDFTFRLPPVPAGTYEIRIGYSATDWRGVAQMFIDGQIQGIPLDLSKGCVKDDPEIGWVADATQADGGVENDKAMRNRGYMKAPASICCNDEPLRDKFQCLRRIIGTFNLTEGPHYFRMKNVEDPNRVFQFDYIEIVPTSVLDNEDKN